MNNLYTGQVFIREAQSSQQPPKGKRLVMFAGVIAVDETFPLEGEHQYVVVGESTNPQQVTFTVITRGNKSVEQLEEEVGRGPLSGLSIDGMLLSPIWRV